MFADFWSIVLKSSTQLLRIGKFFGREFPGKETPRRQEAGRRGEPCMPGRLIQKGNSWLKTLIFPLMCFVGSMIVPCPLTTPEWQPEQAVTARWPVGGRP